MSSPAESPDLAYSPLSSAGYLSPAESDAIQTPFLGESDPHFDFAPAHLDDHGIRRDNPIHIPSFDADTENSKESHYPRIQMQIPPPPPPFLCDSPVEDYFSLPRLSAPSPSLSDALPLPQTPFFRHAASYSPHFPADHLLDPHFARAYQLGDELGAGGYGFVMTATNRAAGFEVAVKFIIKDKVPDYAWVEDDRYGRLPTEVFLLDYMDHENIVKGVDLFQDALYFYLVQELHGSPWPKAIRKKRTKVSRDPSPSPSLPPPSLTPSVSADSFSDTTTTAPATPPAPLDFLLPSSGSSSQSGSSSFFQPGSSSLFQPDSSSLYQSGSSSLFPHVHAPQFGRRPSHDLFECIEQSAHKRLGEEQARYVFRQVVSAVHYLDSQGIAHRDIKDENIAIDADFNVKLIDFGSAIYVDPSRPRPYYTLFYGTTAYAASEILLKRPYQAAPAEVWTLGVLLSYLLHGMSPFPTAKDAVKGRIVLDLSAEESGSGRGGGREGRGRVSGDAYELMRWCLDPDPVRRATIGDVRRHRWLA